jgi:cob(I)alamin adenosyltransferase
MSSKISKGLVQVYTGTGKGKTTAALGLALRAVGKGLKVYMIQFMKGDIEYGEITTAKNMENFEIIQIGRPDFVDKSNPAEIDIKLANEALDHAREMISSDKYDIVILDEINVAVDWKLIKVDKVIELIKTKPEHVELVLTGRYAPQEIIDIADLVTEMQEIKHPYNDGVEARDGIEH